MRYNTPFKLKLIYNKSMNIKNKSLQSIENTTPLLRLTTHLEKQ